MVLMNEFYILMMECQIALARLFIHEYPEPDLEKSIALFGNSKLNLQVNVICLYVDK